MSDDADSRLTLDHLVALNRSAMLARLLSGVAHEVNNALQVIGGSVELLEGDPNLPASAATRLTRIRTQQTRAAAVISGLLAFAREGSEAKGRIDIREVVSQAVALRTYAANRAGIRLTVSAPTDETFIVYGNRMELQQVLLNLIANAEQALAGISGAQVDVTVGAEDGHVAVRVADNGPGIPGDLAQRVFEPFFTTRPSREAAGLGLAVAHTIAQQSGGTITVEPRAEGSCVVLKLPAG